MALLTICSMVLESSASQAIRGNSDEAAPAIAAADRKSRRESIELGSKKGCPRRKNRRARLINDRQDIFFTQNQQFIAIYRNFRAGIGQEDHFIPLVHLV